MFSSRLMRSNSMDFHLKLLLLGFIISMASAQPNPNCSNSCGSLSIPYPFGTEEGCYFDDSFLITCNRTSNPPKPLLRHGNINVLNISLSGELRISTFVARECYNESGIRINQTESKFQVSKFPISSHKNKFTAVGCKVLALIEGTLVENYTTGCISACDSLDSVVNSTCSGIGCCETAIPGVRDFHIRFGTLTGNHSRVLDFNPCGYAFVVERGFYEFSSLDLKDFQKKTTVPVLLDWAIANVTCLEAKKNVTSFACKAEFSGCYDWDNGNGYRCNCSQGYEGNPYLVNGCQDIDECVVSNPCNHTCTNLQGSVSCSCPKGYEGDGLRVGNGCARIDQNSSERFSILIIALSISISLLFLLVGISWIYWALKKRRLIKLKEKYFQQNGGIMFKQQLSGHTGTVETAKIFTAEELKKATNNYDESRVLGQGGYGTVYKGILSDNKMVAIKKSKIGDQSQIEQFINEVIVLSQVIHKNVVKLLGCCLETEVPLLVYEFVTNGTLSDHIHDESRTSSLSWEIRLKIAAETAGALAYLHTDTSMPIIHRDIKTTNILLDDNYIAKVADFGASRLVPLDQSQLNTLVQGTWGYLDPEYFLSGQLTEKSDVYSFGVVLAELLTGKMALSFDRPEAERNLAMCFITAMKEDRIIQIIDTRMVNEQNIKEIKEVANLAKRCLRVKGEERPNMKEVVMELEGLRITDKHPWEKHHLCSEESEFLPLIAFNGDDGTATSSTTTTVAYDSMRNQILIPMNNGR